MFSHLLERESEAGDHDRASSVAVVGQTLWMDLKPPRRESCRQDWVLTTQRA